MTRDKREFAVSESTKHARLWPVQKLIGNRVENFDGEDLGKLVNVMISLSTAAIDFAVIDFSAVYGMGARLYAVPFHELRRNHEKKIFIINRDTMYLRSSPGRARDQEINDREYLERVKRFYWSAAGSAKK